PMPALTATPIATPTPAPTPQSMPGAIPANEGDILISEVQYDPPQSGVDTAFEWLEIFNRATHTVDLTGWKIADNNGIDPIPSLTISPDGLAVIAAGADFYTNFPDFRGKIVFIPDGSIGNGLSNTGDRLILMDSTGRIIDALSYGSDVALMSPSCPDVAEGHSLERQPVDVDTDEAGDFLDRETPSPGYGPAIDAPAPTPVPVPTITDATIPIVISTPSPTAAAVVLTPTPTTAAVTTPGTTPSPTPAPTPLATQTSSPPGQSRTWLYVWIPSVVLLIGVSSLAFVVLLKRRPG
ncbi:MAG: lamin tail domain-containing protein, partial [Dehalococcoidia bacterium]